MFAQQHSHYLCVNQVNGSSTSDYVDSLNPGTYNVTAADINGCVSDPTYVSLVAPDSKYLFLYSQFLTISSGGNNKLCYC